MSLAQRIAVKTMRRPMVKLNTMNRPRTDATVLASGSSSSLPLVAMPKVMAMITQPIVSSMMAEATMIWPRLRRMKFISRTTMATILTEEIDSAVPRNRPATRRWLGFGQQRCGQELRQREAAGERHDARRLIEIEKQAAPTLRTSLRSVSMPVSSSSIRMPSWRRRRSCPSAHRSGKTMSCAVGPDPAEQRRAEQDAGDQLAHYRRLADALENFAEDAADDDQQNDLENEHALGRTALAGFDRTGGPGLHQRKEAGPGQENQREPAQRKNLGHLPSK